MEDDNINNSSEPIAGESPTRGARATAEKIEEIKIALRHAEKQVESANINLSKQLIVWITICFVIVGMTTMLLSIFLLTHISKSWTTWQIISHTLLRITIIVALFTLAGFCFKMLRSNLHMYHYNKHRESVIKSMPSYIASVQDEDKMTNKLIDIVTDFGEAGILTKENKSESEELNKSQLMDIIMKLIERDKKP